MIRNLFEKHKEVWDREALISFVLSVCFFLASLVVQKIADTYVLSLKGVAVNDIILNNIRTIDIDPLIVQGALLLTLLAVLLFSFKPKYINFGIKSIALFIFTRSFFISLTHLGASPHQVVFDPNSFGFGLYDLLYNTHNDFFFSGHTGFPFLLALIFWPEKRWRYTFFCISFILGVSVLLGHIHYSIDVFAAPFMTYSIFTFAKIIFKKDYKVSLQN